MITIDVKEEPIRWEELTNYVNKPIYDSNSGKWYILYGYKEKKKKIIIVNNHDSYSGKPQIEKRFDETKLYDHEVNNEKEESKNN